MLIIKLLDSLSACVVPYDYQEDYIQILRDPEGVWVCPYQEQRFCLLYIRITGISPGFFQTDNVFGRRGEYPGTDAGYARRF